MQKLAVELSSRGRYPVISFSHHRVAPYSRWSTKIHVQLNLSFYCVYQTCASEVQERQKILGQQKEQTKMRREDDLILIVQYHVGYHVFIWKCMGVIHGVESETASNGSVTSNIISPNDFSEEFLRSNKRCTF
jgi:hypothetical protein